MRHLSENFSYLTDTGADYLLLVAAAHVFGPVLVFDVQTSCAARFVAADRIARGGSCKGYVHASQIPAGSEGWIWIGLLKGRHFVHCRSKALQSDELVMMCDERDKELEALRVDVPHAVHPGNEHIASHATIFCNHLAKFMLPKRRIWKTEQKIGRVSARGKHFSRA